MSFDVCHLSQSLSHLCMIMDDGFYNSPALIIPPISLTVAFLDCPAILGTPNISLV